MKTKLNLQETLTKARELQARYDAHGAPSTQRVRNILPMHRLVRGILTPLADGMDYEKAQQMHRNPEKWSWTRPVTVTILGQKFQKEIQISVAEVADKLGNSFNQILEDLKAAGHPNVNPATVHQTLSNLKRNGLIGAVTDKSNAKRRGRPTMKYFVCSR